MNINPIVSLPWYNFRETEYLIDQVWHSLKKHCDLRMSKRMPTLLDRKTPHLKALASPNLVMTQTCGFDIAAGTLKPLKMIATPIYQTEGASNGEYSSFLVTRKDSKIDSLSCALAKGRFVANDNRSFSGYHCILESYSVKVHWSGSHLQSIEMIKYGAADWAAIDVVTWGLLMKYRPEFVSDLKIFGQTRKVLAPPLVTSALTSDCEVENMRKALTTLCEDPIGKKALTKILINGFQILSEQQYQESIYVRLN